MLEMDNKAGSLVTDHSVPNHQDVLSNPFGNSCGLGIKPFDNRGSEYAAYSPWSHTNDILGLRRDFNGTNNQMLQNSSEFQIHNLTANRLLLQPYRELNASDPWNLPASSQMNPMASMGCYGLRDEIYGVNWDLGFMPDESLLAKTMTRAFSNHIGSSKFFPNDSESGYQHDVWCEGFTSSRLNYSNRSYNGFCFKNNTKLDILSERNRGPRSYRVKGKTNTITRNQYEMFGQNDNLAKYKDAKFFVIKSYSEDNVHKSIKYGVWASTTNGNKKLDAAYREAKDKIGSPPVFLLFSVNGSAQFCGVAEMIGRVDFNKSVECWQQDRWTGHFAVKWLLIKDVPNALFRHILLQNNDYKPVTNSRDTQEVGVEQGVEMLSIFKNYEMNSSILDDFGFYEGREKAMHSRKGKQRNVLEASMVPATDVLEASVVSTQLPTTVMVNTMCKSFADALILNEKKTSK